MTNINEHYLKLAGAYLFPEIARRVSEYAAENPQQAARIIRCGIGDVTEPLPASVVEAMHNAVDEMAHRETFRGYAPPTGYEFLRAAIAKADYHEHGLDIDADEIFISDGSKTDCGAILDILGDDNRTGVTDPTVDFQLLPGSPRSCRWPSSRDSWGRI